MRLKKMKLAGFKSFVDPTTIHFPSDMVGVVGPNGCGKSNIIDAVRWVMGESSRHLRGDSMEDVIFNGSLARKPVGQASIELVFDNTQGGAGGQYAAYNEIALRRQVSRDGQSRYFLNGSKCRRRDIGDLFLGTGMGPRGYSIIEQGMISRLIEARPEDLRSHLEEAAGISKYKERRRETENRLRHTRENMSRLKDLIDEIDKQLKKLQRQARTAERYKALKAEERQVEAELLALRWHEMGEETAGRERVFQAREQALKDVIVSLHTLEGRGEQQRVQYAEANEAFNEAQGRFYQLGSDISRLEQTLHHARETLERDGRELDAAKAALGAGHEELGETQARVQELATRTEALSESLLGARQALAEAESESTECESRRNAWDQRWRELNQQISRPNEQAQVERTRIEHLERQLTRSEQRQQRLREDLQRLGVSELEEESQRLETELGELRSQAQDDEARLQAVGEQIEDRRERNAGLREALDERRSRAQREKGRLASLEALQEAALGKREGEALAWLSEHGLAEASRLAEHLSVEPGWEAALETVLGDFLEAVCVQGLPVLDGGQDSGPPGSLILFDTGGAGQTPERIGGLDAQALLTRVSAPWPLDDLLADVRAVEGLTEALAARGSLDLGASVVTRAGEWFGRHWFRTGGAGDEHAGVLVREAEIKTLGQSVAALEAEIGQLETEVAAGHEVLRELESEREARQRVRNQRQGTAAQRESQLSRLRGKIEDTNNRISKLRDEIELISEESLGAREELEAATVRRNAALEALEALVRSQEALEGEREALHRDWDRLRTQARERREAVHQLALRLESTRAAHATAQVDVERIEQGLGGHRHRIEQLEGSIQAARPPLADYEQRLAGLVEQRLEAEQGLSQTRDAVQTLEHALRNQERERAELERRIEAERQEVDGLRMAWQESRVRRETVAESLTEAGFDPGPLLEAMDESAAVEVWEARLAELRGRIGRLGPINLAAIQEFQEQSERKDYLDGQQADLSEALETLENAIRKIDRETRQRFKETFDRVNERLQETFPRLFGGGHAHLEMTGDDLLTTGVSIMARPPGKRLSTIHLMSGGEKALTAVALVFAIFELNPAPFCMLDEVDAPLDEANVGRFCELVKQMSKRVQFVFITHNKTTMEYAEQLVGITMHEPGVSRLVAVDVEEAAQMATG